MTDTDQRELTDQLKKAADQRAIDKKLLADFDKAMADLEAMIAKGAKKDDE